MSDQSLYLIKILAVFGIVIAIALYQLYSVERLRKEDEIKRQQQLREADKNRQEKERAKTE